MQHDTSSGDATTDTLAVPLAHSVTKGAERVGVSRAHLYRENAAGRIEFIRIGRRVLVTEDELRRYLADRRAETAA